MVEKTQNWFQTIVVYKDIRMLRILLLGAISGFPWVLIASSLSLWLKEEGLSRSTIGWAGLIFGVYAFNYLWAPLIDRIQIPLLTKKIGHRRGWIVLMQATILISLIVWSLINPTQNDAKLPSSQFQLTNNILSWKGIWRGASLQRLYEIYSSAV